MNTIHMFSRALVAFGMFTLAETTAVKMQNSRAPSAEGAWDYLEIPLGDDSNKDFLSLFQNDITLQRGEHHRVDTELGAVSWILIVLAAVAILAVMYILMEIGKGDDKPTWDTSNMGVRAAPMGASPMAAPLVPTATQSTHPQFSPSMPRTAVQSYMSPPMPSSMGASNRSPVSQSMQPAAHRAPVPVQQSEITLQEESGSLGMTEWLDRALQTFTPKPPKEEKTQTLVVQTHEGVILQSSANASPHAENTTIVFSSLKGRNQVIRARIEERSGQPRILVESASGVPLACLDTSSAISRNGMFTQKSRRVNIHRVPLIGPAFSFTTERPYASVVRIAPGTFLVTNDTRDVSIGDIRDAPNVPGFVLLVKAGADGQVQEMRDRSDVVVRQEGVGAQSRNLWLQRGCDVCLVVSVALAVQKLRD